MMKMNGFNVVISKDYHTWTGRRDRAAWSDGMQVGWISGIAVGFVFGLAATCFILGVLPGIWMKLP